MIKAFLKIAKCLKTVTSRLLQLAGSFINNFTAPSTPQFHSDTASHTAHLKTAHILPSLAGPVILLGGGGPDVEDAIQWMINEVRGCNNCDTKVDVLIIRAYGSNDYNRLIYSMRGVKSVETLIINNKQDANRTDIFDRIRRADVIFFAGGDQCQYIRNWQNTKLEIAVKSVYSRRGGIGGTSAGAMILSDYVYDSCACTDSIESRDALADPYENITFTYNFFQWHHLKDTVVDTHFDSRKRMGRIMAFIARQIQDGITDSALGIAINEETSLVVDKYGVARVMGRGAAYFVLGDHLPEECKPRTPLTFYDYKIWRVPRGDSFDLNNKPTRGYYLRSVKRGRIDGDPY